MAKRRKVKIKGSDSKYAKPFDPNGYRILNTGLRAKTNGQRVLEDLTADLSQYKDTREPQVSGSTIHNPFKAYSWRPTPFNTVKG